MQKKIMERENILMILKIIGIILFCLALTFYFISPLTMEFRSSVYGSILEYGALYGIITYLSLSKRINMPIIGKVTIFIYPTIHLILNVLNLGRISYFIIFIYSLFNIGIAIYLYYKYKKEYKSIWTFGALSFISFILPILRVEHIDEELLFWIPALIICIALFIIALILVIKFKNKIEDRQNIVAIPVLALMGGFVLPWSILCSFNIIFDTSIPAYESFEIIDKYVRSGARQITTYQIEVQNENKTFNIAISKQDFYDIEIGDEITLSIYQGALGARYYIHDNKE